MPNGDDGCCDTLDVSAPAEGLPPPPDWSDWADGLGLGGTDRYHLGWLIQCERMWHVACDRNQALVDAKGNRPEPFDTTILMIGETAIAGGGIIGGIQRWVAFADAETVRANLAEEDLAMADEMAEDFRQIVLCLRNELCEELTDLATIIEHTDGPTAAKLVRQLADRRLTQINLPRRPGSKKPETP